jgi:hypothetical protein
MTDAVRNWFRYVDGLAWCRGHLDESSHLAFLRAGSLGVESRFAFDEVCDRIRAAGDHPRLSKVRSQMKRAFAFARAADALPRNEQRSGTEVKPQFRPSFAEKFASQVPQIPKEWLRMQSAIPPLSVTPSLFLWSLYNFGERIIVLTDQRSQGEVWSKDKLRCDRSELDHFVNGYPEGVWFLPQPVDGLEHYNPRQDRMSRRSEESVTAWRFAVLESDCQPIEQWLRILVQLPLPIVSITSSGGKSVHALVRVDVPSPISTRFFCGKKAREFSIGASRESENFLRTLLSTAELPLVTGNGSGYAH